MDASTGDFVDAINKGNHPEVLRLLPGMLEKYPSVLTDISLPLPPEPLLCVVVRAGRLDFVQNLMRLKAQLAKELNSNGLRPLDIAAENGNVEIVKELVKNDAELCRLKGRDKKTALHHAASNGKVDVINVLLSACSESIKDVTAKGDTALHLAVKRDQVEAFDALGNWLTRLGEEDIINQRDCEKKTVLHIAASKKQPKVVNILKKIKESTAKKVGLRSGLKFAYETVFMLPLELGTQVQNLLLVVAVLFVTLTYQGIINPPEYMFTANLSPANSTGNTSTTTTTTTTTSGNTPTTTTTTTTTSGNTSTSTTTMMIPNGITRSVTTTITPENVTTTITPENVTTTIIPKNVTTTITPENVTTTITPENTTNITIIYVPSHKIGSEDTTNANIISFPSHWIGSASFFLFVNTMAHSASITTVVSVTRQLTYRRELIMSSLCLSTIYGHAVVKLAKKESVPSYLLCIAVILPASMRLLPACMGLLPACMGLLPASVLNVWKGQHRKKQPGAQN